jgi:hypothetical protein
MGIGRQRRLLVTLALYCGQPPTAPPAGLLSRASQAQLWSRHSDRPERLKRRFGLPVQDREERSRRWVWLDTILFPVSDRADWDMKRSGEIGLGHAELAPNSLDRDHEIELCERRVGIFAIYDGVLTDFILGGGREFCMIDDRLSRPQIV